MTKPVSPETLAMIHQAQWNERTEHLAYARLATMERDPANRQVLEQIAQDELDHYVFWKQYSQADVAADGCRVRL